METDPTHEGIQLRITDDTIAVVGELDVVSAPLLLDAVGSIAADAVALDLTEVGFIDSSGLGAVVTAFQRLAEVGRSLTVTGLSPVVARVFEVSGVDNLLGRPPS